MQIFGNGKALDFSLICNLLKITGMLLTSFWKVTAVWLPSLRIVCFGISLPSSKAPSSLSCQAPLKLANYPSLPLPCFKPIPLSIGFSWSPPLKSRIFQWTPEIFEFFILNISLNISDFPLFEKMIGGPTPYPTERREEGAHYASSHIIIRRLHTKVISKYSVFLFWKFRNSYFQGTPLSAFFHNNELPAAKSS